MKKKLDVTICFSQKMIEAVQVSRYIATEGEDKADMILSGHFVCIKTLWTVESVFKGHKSTYPCGQNGTW